MVRAVTLVDPTDHVVHLEPTRVVGLLDIGLINPGLSSFALALPLNRVGIQRKAVVDHARLAIDRCFVLANHAFRATQSQKQIDFTRLCKFFLVIKG